MIVSQFDVPNPVSEAVAEVARLLRARVGLAWVYGQGSTITGFSTESDLDFVAIWNRPPTEPATMLFDAKFIQHGDLALEQVHLGGYEVDIQHVPISEYDRWMAELQAGRGWAGDQWPMPAHVAAGLADGLLIVDDFGAGAALQARLQSPEPALVQAVVEQLSGAAPEYLNAMHQAASRSDLWLHDLLAVQLHKLIYTAWFLLEGHYPPFPKYLPDWFERNDMDAGIRQLEATYWATTELPDRDQLLQELTSAVLRLRR